FRTGSTRRGRLLDTGATSTAGQARLSPRWVAGRMLTTRTCALPLISNRALCLCPLERLPSPS
ncbi:hypothetical protein LPJ73_008509, partial [Coemansia sp. RSA 2703]